MDDRTRRLIDKAEKSIDLNDLEQAEAYRVLANAAEYHRRREVKELNRTLEVTHDER